MSGALETAGRTSAHGRVAVFDVGKTNLKLSLIDADGRVLSEARRANGASDGPPYPHFDVEGIWEWLLSELARLPRREQIGSIITTTHGATVALVGEGALTLPVLDYEFAGVDEVDAAYAALRDGFDQTLSPALAGGLNVGKQLYWQAQKFPEAFACIRAIMPYAQYWSWRLSGVAASEVTSWGCHTDLWNPVEGRYASLVKRMGWERQFPPLRKAFDTLGALRPAVAQRTGLPSDCRELCGIHDSNASMVKHLFGAAHEGTAQKPMNVISTGTWALIASIGAPLGQLDPARDMLANVDAWGRPFACARFMGGREFSLLNAGHAEDCSWDDLAALIGAGTLALPSFAAMGGPWPGRHGVIRGAAPTSPEASYALATLYCALVTDDCLTRLQGGGDIVIEGAFTANRHYAALLAALRPQQRVWVSEDRSGTTGGAYLLACQPAAHHSPRSRALLCPISGLLEYRARWRAAVVES